MACNTAQFREQFLTGHSQRLIAPTATQPCRVVARLHGYHPADHARVLSSAVLRTEQMVGTGFGGSEPDGGIAAGEHVLLDAKCRHEKAVDHVLRGHNQFDVAADRHMELVDFALASLVLE